MDFDKNVQGLLETFQCGERFETSYNFALVKAAWRAMSSASKVSVRVDGQGVLSLQFLIEVEEAGGAGGAARQGGEAQDAGREGVAFVDFRVVPLVEGEAEGEGDGDGEGAFSDEDE